MCTVDQGETSSFYQVGAQGNVVQERKSTLISRSSLFSSSGILEGKTSREITLDSQAGKWKTEYGEAMAAKLEKAVKESMSDYEYLKSHRLTLYTK
ncbi:hypothetical protein FQN49_002219 [Arthroderma sp. PD_2]|nr:hypothetical protein FQN49_002219 [Arthroderma sp. PD_2]